jgi:hypothetical protein
MPKVTTIEIVEKNCGARLRSKKTGFLRVAPQTSHTTLNNNRNPLRSKRGAKRSNCGGETPHTPLCVPPQHAGEGALRGTPRHGD